MIVYDVEATKAVAGWRHLSLTVMIIFCAVLASMTPNDNRHKNCVHTLGSQASRHLPTPSDLSLDASELSYKLCNTEKHHNALK